MKRMGYIIGLVIGIPLFIIVVNFLLFNGNDTNEKIIGNYIENSNKIIVIVPVQVKLSTHKYIKGLSRGGRPSGFLWKYSFFDRQYDKYFCMMIYMGFDKNSNIRPLILRRNDEGDKISVTINKNQLKNVIYGTKENPIPVFPIDILNLKGGYPEDPFHVSDELHEIFVEQYLKFFMPKEEFKEMFNK